MKSHRFRMLTLLVMLIPAVGCQSSGSNPKDVVTKYLDATLDGNHQEAYNVLSSSDKKTKSIAEYISERNQSGPLVNIFADKVSYKIKSVKTSDKNAEIEVEVTGPDLKSLMGDLFSEALSSLGNNMNENEMQKMLAEKFKEKGMPVSTRLETFKLVKEQDGWKVFFNWESEEFLSKARELKDQQKYYAAIDNYNKALELNGEMVEAKKEIEDVKKEIATYEEKQSYIKHIELKDLKVGEGTRFGFGKPEPGIFGTIVNKGDRTLLEVQITVYFLDDTGNSIGEKDYHPVLVTEYSISDNKPLKPNYVKDFGYIIGDSAPSTWSGNINANITNIEFQD